MKSQPVYLLEADVMDVWIEGLGIQRPVVPNDALT